jgi:hypothetical protein
MEKHGVTFSCVYVVSFSTFAFFNFLTEGKAETTPAKSYCRIVWKQKLIDEAGIRWDWL